eukprot:TRINITY_DN7944_c1_g6_i1.p1 TRINITY_DN7944_c1_g6~~TRINITY_DN7944_c1_g6_i1.p1  ORF type:complete len:410 (+),score=49.01 TRINITY_DN7944_c1_g6_i1:89-1231(+)
MVAQGNNGGFNSEWYYLDSTAEEFGPFPGDVMLSWMQQGLFPIGGELRVRLPEWSGFVPLRRLYPRMEVTEIFISPPGPVPPEFHEVVYGSRGGSFGSCGSGREKPGRGGGGGQRGGYGGGGPPAQTRPDGSLYASGDGCGGGPGFNGGGFPAGGQPYLVRPDGSPFPMGDPGSPPVGMMVGGPGGCQLAGMPAGAPFDLSGCQLQVLQPGPGGMPPQGCAPQSGMAPPMQGSNGAGRRFRGRIKSYNSKQGFGFIDSAEAFNIYGRDVFLHRAQVGDLPINTEVIFGVELNKGGMPQARQITTLDGRSPGPAVLDNSKGDGRGDNRGKGARPNGKGGGGRGGGRGGRKGGGRDRGAPGGVGDMTDPSPALFAQGAPASV